MGGVLIVDDDALLCSTISEFLADAGVTAYQAGNADEAVAFLGRRAGEIAVLFTDICMPGSRDGLELAQLAQRNWPWLRVVITSGGASSVYADVPPNVYFLAKPWLTVDLVKCVMRALSDFAAFQITSESAYGASSAAA
jgi:DNA-binding NtrC family response regulator